MSSHLRIIPGVIAALFVGVMLAGSLLAHRFDLSAQQAIGVLGLPQRTALEIAMLDGLADRLALRAQAPTGGPAASQELLLAEADQAIAILRTQSSSRGAADLAADLARLAGLARAAAAPQPPANLTPAEIDAARVAAAYSIAAYERELAERGQQLSGLFDNQALLYMVAALIASAALGGLLYSLSRSILGPLHTINQALIAVSTGDLSHSLPDRLPGPFAPIVATYQIMTRALREHQQSLDDQLRRTSLLTQLSIELRETIDTRTIAERVLRTVGGSPGIDAAVLLQAGGPGGEAGFVWRAGLVRALDEGATHRLISQGLEGLVLHHHGSIILTDVSQSERWRTASPYQSGSAIVLPIRQAETTLGSLTIYAARTGAFTNHDLLLMEGVAAQTGVALTAARRYQEERQRRDQAVALLSISQYLTVERSYSDLARLLEEQVRAIFHADHGLLYLRPVGVSMRPLPVGPAPSNLTPNTLLRITDAATRACASQQIVTIGPPADDNGPICIALPLVHAGSALGACVLVQSPGRSATLPANLWSLLTIFTNIIAAASANLQLVDQLRIHAGQLEELVNRRTDELRRSRDLLRIMFDNMPEGMMLIGADGQLLAANNAFCRGIVGRVPREVVGQHYPELWHNLEQQADLRIEIQGPRDHQAAPIMPGPGEPFVPRGGSWQLVGTDFVGQQRWYAVDRIPILGPSGEIEQCLERWSDITHQEELRRRLLLHEQLTSLGRLAASVAHEVGNPLQSALGCLELCREEAALTPQVREYLDLALGELERMARTMQSLRNLYRPPQLTWEQVRLNELLRQVVQFTQRQMIRAQVQVVLDLEPDLPRISGQTDTLRQVFLNLLLNAQEAMHDGGVITVSTRRKPTDRLCEVAIHDTGVGMSQEQLERVFEAFQSAKAQGVGLGLYLSRQIIEQHGGHIEISSQHGEGTVVCVRIPWSDAGPV